MFLEPVRQDLVRIFTICNDSINVQISHNYTLKQEFVEANLFDLVTPYDAMDWKLYSMMTDQEKGLCGGW